MLVKKRKKKASGVSLSRKQATELRACMDECRGALRDTNLLLARLAAPTVIASSESMRRFNAWAAAELDRKTQRKAPIEDMPPALIAASQEKIQHWLSDAVREFEAVRIAAEESLKLSGLRFAAQEIQRSRRDIAARWPDARLP